jgi:hypothetical protein
MRAKRQKKKEKKKGESEHQKGNEDFAQKSPS